MRSDSNQNFVGVNRNLKFLLKNLSQTAISNNIGIIRNSANNRGNQHSSPFTDIEFINEESIGYINEEIIGAINRATIGAIIARRNPPFCFVFFMFYCFTCTIN